MTYRMEEGRHRLRVSALLGTTMVLDVRGHRVHRGGADRIAANGDVANKVGTYGVAVLAKEHNLPFYVAAPLSTVDLATPDGARIPIEERSDREVTHVGTSRLTPEGARIRNPAFDVTPAKYVTAIVTERGIAWPPYASSLAELFRRQS